MSSTYICGCSPAEKIHYSTDYDPDTNMPIPRCDSQGYLVCPEHGERMVGWHSEITDDDGRRLTDWSKKSKTQPKLNLDFSHEPDRRDNRDPQSIPVAVSVIDIGVGVLYSTEEQPLYEVSGYRERRYVPSENGNGGSSLHKGRRLEIVYDADMQSRLRERP